jgi:hypothetical protein
LKIKSVVDNTIVLNKKKDGMIFVYGNLKKIAMTLHGMMMSWVKADQDGI